MSLQLFMLGLTVQDMAKSLEFYKRLGLDLPETKADQTHVEVKMQGEYTFFLDSKPIKSERDAKTAALASYDFVMEFLLPSRAILEAKFQELKDFGYEIYRDPFEVEAIKMYFALVNDPDGNTILLSTTL